MDMDRASDRGAEPFFEHRGGMEALGAGKTQFSAAAKKWRIHGRRNLFCSGNGKFRASRPDRKFRLANVRRRTEVAVWRAAGSDGVLSVPEADAGANGDKFWIQLWHPFLRHWQSLARRHSW